MKKKMTYSGQNIPFMLKNSVVLKTLTDIYDLTNVLENIKL